MFYQSPNAVIHESELSFSFCRSGGPGGQHVNKVSTAVQMKFNITESHISTAMKLRLKKLAGRRVSSEGVLLLTANKHRSQRENRLDTEERLRELLVEAEKIPRKRKPTKATKASQERRLKKKTLHKNKKAQRKKVNPMDTG